MASRKNAKHGIPGCRLRSRPWKTGRLQIPWLLRQGGSRRVGRYSRERVRDDFSGL